MVLVAGCIDASPEATVPKNVSKPADDMETTPPPRSAAPADPDTPDAASPAAIDRGNRFRDPPWYRQTIFSTEQGTLATESRSEADELGRFKSHMVFELTDMTVEQCADHLDAAMKASVTNLERAQKPGNRLEVIGSTDRYNVTFICGEAKGKMRAYVAYEWTS